MANKRSKKKKKVSNKKTYNNYTKANSNNKRRNNKSSNNKKNYKQSSKKVNIENKKIIDKELEKSELEDVDLEKDFEKLQTKIKLKEQKDNKKKDFEKNNSSQALDELINKLEVLIDYEEKKTKMELPKVENQSTEEKNKDEKTEEKHNETLENKEVFDDSNEGNSNSDELVLDENNRKHRTKKIFIVLLCLIIVGLLIVGYSLFVPHIRLLGDKTIILNYKEQYREPGYEGVSFNNNITSKVKVTGHVNTKKLGTYILKYTINYKGIKTSTKRVVKVRDLSKPVISLNGNKTTLVCPNTNYNEEGYKAYDNYDGNITKKVEVIKNEEYYLYKVEDSSGNKHEVRRKLIYEDKVKPVIKVKDHIFINQGDEYNNKYSALDNCDGDITDKVKVKGNVDINKVGDYNLEYVVSDKAQNQITVKQVVHVTKQDAPGTIYLTFDDGPNEGTTNVILDILKEEGVRATFFVTNNGPDELIKRENDEGHTVAIHTATHNYSNLYSSVDAYYNDLRIVQERILRLTGKKSMIVRFPGGSSNTVSRRYAPGIMSTLTQDLINQGYRYYDWNVNSGDADICRDSACVYNQVINHLSHDRVNMVLMHDIKPYTRDALRDIIRYAKENGYTFATINENTEMIRQRVNN